MLIIYRNLLRLNQFYMWLSLTSAFLKSYRRNEVHYKVLLFKLLTVTKRSQWAATYPRDWSWLTRGVEGWRSKFFNQSSHSLKWKQVTWSEAQSSLLHNRTCIFADLTSLVIFTQSSCVNQVLCVYELW